MAIDTMDKLIAGLELGSRINILKVQTTSEGAGTYHSLYKVAGNPASATANPPTGVGEIPTKSTLGSLIYTNPTGVNKKYIGRINVMASTIGSLIIYDRLWHNSGLVGNVATAQTVNSVALTRYTDGQNVEIFAEFYTAIGATGATLSVNYTDADDVARVGTYTHPANAETAGQIVVINPPVGARGCKSIQSTTWSVTTGTAGNFGLTMGRRLSEIPMGTANITTALDAFGTGMPEIQTDACLCMAVMCSTTNTGNIVGAIDIIEG